jgi:hypothetical protein
MFDLFMLFVIDYSLVYVLVVQLLVCGVRIKRHGQILIKKKSISKDKRKAINMLVKMKLIRVIINKAIKKLLVIK